MRLPAPRFELLRSLQGNGSYAIKDLHTGLIVFTTMEWYPKGYNESRKIWKQLNTDWEESEQCRRNSMR